MKTPEKKPAIVEKEKGGSTDVCGRNRKRLAITPGWRGIMPECRISEKKRRRNQNKKRIYRCLLKKQKSKKTCNYAGIAVNYAGITGNYAGIIGNKPAGNMNS